MLYVYCIVCLSPKVTSYLTLFTFIYLPSLFHFPLVTTNMLSVSMILFVMFTCCFQFYIPHLSEITWLSTSDLHYLAQKQYGGSLKKLRMELPYDPAIPLLGIYPPNLKMFIHKNICTLIFTAVLFMVAKTKKELKSPSIDD
uniref:Uncharacterized protein n=1 Tax=Rousettus aegyptiacus TaxID=9407 RepID=A0A7J8DXU9_ROUAE|nr:hypothetical protein HJG63_008404 [Rousettus aegyptiacus]